MISLASVSRPYRNLLLWIVTGVILLIVLQAGFTDGFGGLGSYDADRTATLGVAKKIYVLSLPNRTDRRHEMEKLKGALGLRWTYVYAIDTKNRLIERIVNAVSAVRAKNGGPFTWPAVMPPRREHINQWSPDFLALSAKTDGSHPSHPMLCATENNTVAAYEPNLPEFLIITPARIACWYSHLSVIEKVANDNSLKDDDTVIVLEDDVDMERDTHARLKHVWAYLPEEWDIVYLGHCWSDENFYPALNAHETVANFNGSVTHIHPSKTPACTHGYALTRSGARRILVHLRYAPFAYSRAIDLAISWLVQTNRIKSFSIFPSIVVQRILCLAREMTGRMT